MSMVRHALSQFFFFQAGCRSAGTFKSFMSCSTLAAYAVPPDKFVNVYPLLVLLLERQLLKLLVHLQTNDVYGTKVLPASRQRNCLTVR
ncbi:hypothetical protein EVAR_45292_1 [Eumeta japonica]|uniref:Uncharacterized protein n=1 Tax=Eumeta variegata TaxID=151549 RepID=A0A4C1YBV1_EUMVA|nr:hypothetical protein EVAR_45292_1 [Eumeta japonica]